MSGDLMTVMVQSMSGEPAVNNRDIIVIGASAGGVSALRTLTGGLPLDLPAAVFVVIHSAANGPGMLAEVLDNASSLPVAYAVDGEPIERGRIYLAPRNHHLLIKNGSVELSPGPRENRSRPAVDPLFRSAARAYGNRVIGTILTGNLDDGSRGLLLVKQHGGLAVVQDPNDALYPGMPSSALDYVAVDHVVPLARMAELFGELTREALPEGASNTSSRPTRADEVVDPDTEREQPGARSSFICPECGGSMRETQQKGFLHYRCHVGHAFGGQTLLDQQSQAVEAALWTALRTLEDHAALRRRLAENARTHNLGTSAANFTESAEDVGRQAEVLRKLLLGA